MGEGFPKRESQNLSPVARRTKNFLDAMERTGFVWIFKSVSFLLYDPKEPLIGIRNAVTNPAEDKVEKLEKQNREILERLSELQNDVDRLKQSLRNSAG